VRRAFAIVTWPTIEMMNMGDSTYLTELLTELKKYGAGDPKQSDIEALEIELYNGPDRAAAIVLGSLVEKAIGKLLIKNRREEDVNFSSKIDISYSLNLFGEATKRELTIIRHLRNQFAHSRIPIEFTTSVVKRCCDQLTYPDAPGVLIPFNYVNKVSDLLLEDAGNKFHPRTRYFISCNEIAQRIYFIHSGDVSDPRNHLL
jgi:hypothetical protein